MNNQPLIILQALHGNMPTSLHPIQEILAPHLPLLKTFWWIVFVAVLICLALKVVRDYWASTTE
jgi:hypothetical protein